MSRMRWSLVLIACLGCAKRSKPSSIPATGTQLVAPTHNDAADPVDAATDAGPAEIASCDLSHAIERARVDELLSDPDRMLRWAQIVPRATDAGTVQVTLRGIAVDTPLHRWGFRDGDVLVRINGMDLTSPESTVRMYETARQSSQLRVAIERGGDTRNICFHAVDGPE